MNPRSEPIGMFVRAFAFAADKHRIQRRKDADASPYINHPIALANVLANEGGMTDVAVLCAADPVHSRGANTNMGARLHEGHHNPIRRDRACL